MFSEYALQGLTLYFVLLGRQLISNMPDVHSGNESVHFRYPSIGQNSAPGGDGNQVTFLRLRNEAAFGRRTAVLATKKPRAG